MTAANFATGTQAVVRQGWGYWDVTSYPYGGCFKRASSAFIVTVTGPGQHPNEVSATVAGRKLVISTEALAR